MRLLLSLLALLAGVVFAAASAAMNHAYMVGQAESAYKGQIYGAIAVAVSLSNVVLPFLIAAAWQRGAKSASAIGTVVFVFFLGFSLLSALGFSREQRDAVSGSREAMTVRHQEAGRDLAREEAALAALGSPRPQAVVDADLGKARQDRNWISSKGCEEAATPAAREFCKSVFDLRRELASAVAAQRHQERIGTLKAEARKLEDRGAGRAGDPQARLLSELSGYGENGARLFLTVFIAILVELGAAFLPFLAFAPWRGKNDMEAGKRDVAVAPEPLVAEIIEPAAVRRPAKRLELGHDGALIVR